jgi:hypothetical protein
MKYLDKISKSKKNRYVANRWEFMTDGGDIAFRIYNKNSEDIVPMNRVDSHIIMEEGQVTCDEPGQCKLNNQFENKFFFPFLTLMSTQMFSNSTTPTAIYERKKCTIISLSICRTTLNNQFPVKKYYIY